MNVRLLLVGTETWIEAISSPGTSVSKPAGNGACRAFAYLAVA